MSRRAIAQRLIADGRIVTRPVLAGLVLSAAEVGLVLARGRDRFLGGGELALYVATAVPLAIALCTALYAVGSAAMHLVGASRPLPRGAPVGKVARRAGLVAALVTGPAVATLLWVLSEGRRLRELPGRPLLVVLGGAAVAAVIFWVVARVVRASHAGRRRALRVVAALACGVAVAALVADATVLPRLYPALHWALAIAALLAALLATAVWPRDRWVGAARAHLSLALGLGSFVAAALLLPALRQSSNVSYAVERTAPLTGKVVLALRRGTGATAIEAAPRVPGTAPGGVAPGIDLVGRDVLVITVDALRADRLAAWGGAGIAPHMDALAEESVVFRRAYTTTPHTSHALGSLWTGKYLASVWHLSEEPQSHPTLPDLLEEAGYRTAAFYPPAIFFVDEGRFDQMREQAFGFDHHEVGFVGAEARVEQALSHLATLEGEPRVFFWAHFFEPHEPYEATGDDATARYDGEVARADAAVGALVAGFRARRPDATVILTADHGEELGDHGGRYHGTTLYDEQVRVPLLWSSPGLVEPRVIDVPVDLPDVATTLLAALGVPRDARMRGDDLGPLLAGHADLGPTYAFAQVGDRHMVVDGRYKAICAVGATGCLLFDLRIDPGERRNLGPSRPEEVARLRGALAEHLASIPRVELRGETDAAQLLSRAELDDPTLGAELVPLLRAAEAPVRARAALALGRLAHEPALPVLGRLRGDDPDAEVRAAAAVAALSLGDEEARAQVGEVAQDEARPASVRRPAALELAARGVRVGIPVLLELASDPSAPRQEREAAVGALAALRAHRAVPVLTGLLEDLQLRIVAAEALGRIGDRRAATPLFQALSREPYAAARAAEAGALARLGDRRAEGLIRGWLGVEDGLPGGVGLLLELGELRWPTGGGADLRTARRVQEGEWACDEAGCRVGPGAALALPRVEAPRGEAVAVLRVVAARDGDALIVDGRRRVLREGAQEVSFAAGPGQRPRRLEVSTEGEVTLLALAVVAARADPTARPVD